MQKQLTENDHVIRISTLMTSSILIANLNAPPLEKGSLALDMEDQFKKYLKGEEIDEEFFAPSEFKSELDKD